MLNTSLLHKTLKYKHTFTYKRMFLYCGDTSTYTYVTSFLSPSFTSCSCSPLMFWYVNLKPGEWGTGFSVSDPEEPDSGARVSVSRVLVSVSLSWDSVVMMSLKLASSWACGGKNYCKWYFCKFYALRINNFNLVCVCHHSHSKWHSCFIVPIITWTHTSIFTNW